MKKLLYLFAFLTVILSSCSSEDEEIQGDLITKMKFMGSDFNDSYENHEFNLEYIDGNKLVRIIDIESDKKEFHYTGDLITKIDIWKFWNGSDLEFERSIYLEYDSEERLINIKIDEGDNNEVDQIIEFDYIDDNNANYTHHYENNLSGYGTVTFNEDDVIKRLDNNWSLGQPYRKEITYNYDDKKHPYTGIRGYKKLKLFNAFYGSIYYLSHNINDDYGFAPNWGTTKNVISTTIRSGNNLENTSTIPLFSYEYGNNNLPAKSNKIYGGTNTQIICTYN